MHSPFLEQLNNIENTFRKHVCKSDQKANNNRWPNSSSIDLSFTYSPNNAKQDSRNNQHENPSQKFPHKFDAKRDRNIPPNDILRFRCSKANNIRLFIWLKIPDIKILSRFTKTQVVSDFSRNRLRVEMLNNIRRLGVLETYDYSWCHFWTGFFVLLPCSEFHLLHLLLSSFDHLLKTVILSVSFRFGIGEPWILFHLQHPISKKFLLLQNVMIKSHKFFIKYLRLAELKRNSSTYFFDGKRFQYLSPLILHIVIKNQTVKVPTHLLLHFFLSVVNRDILKHYTEVRSW